MARSELELHDEIVVVNARVCSTDARMSGATAIAARDGIIAHIGNDRDALDAVSPRAKRVDAQGHFLMPGFYDSHVHLLNTGLGMLKPSLAGSKSIGDVQAIVSRSAAALPLGDWLELSPSWHESQLSENRFPTRAELDAVAPRHPVFIRRGGHNAVLNSAALRELGIAEDAQNPPGATYVRDSDGTLTGHVVGLTEVMRLAKRLPQPAPAEVERAIHAAGAMMASHGITSVIDPGLSGPQMSLFQQLAAERALRQRVGMLWMAPSPAAFGGDAAAALDSEPFTPRFQDPWCRALGIKLLADGGVETGFYREAYKRQDDPAFPCGKPLISPEDLGAMCLESAKRRWHVAVHVLGNAAIDMVLDAFEEADRHWPIRDLRWSLVHLMNPEPDHWPRIGSLRAGVTVQQPLLWQLAQGFADYIGETRTSRLLPLRTILKQAANPVGGGSDSPIAPVPPLLAIQSCVTRETRTGATVGSDEALTVDQALHLYSTGSAWVGFEEQSKGRLTLGRVADLVLLSDDPRRVAPDEISAIQVLLTLAGDRITHAVLT